MIALLPAYMKIDRGVCSSRWSGSCEDQPYSAGNGSFCSVQVEFLFVLLRLGRPLRVQPGVHCILPVRRSIICFAEEAHERVQHDGFSGRGCRTQFSSSTVTLWPTEFCTFMLTPCGSQPFKFIAIHLVWHWPVCCDCAVVMSARTFGVQRVQFQHHKDDKVRCVCCKHRTL